MYINILCENTVFKRTFFYIFHKAYYVITDIMIKREKPALQELYHIKINAGIINIQSFIKIREMKSL